MKSSIAIGALVALAFAGAAIAQDAAGGKVTLAQLQQSRLARLQQADTNHDGKISKAEFAAAHAYPARASASQALNCALSSRASQ